MENEFKDMYKFLEENNLGCSGINIDILRHEDIIENKEKLIQKIKDVNERYEHNPNKYSEDIMQQLRLRLGLKDKYDTSLDEEINNMNKDIVFENLLGWNGLRGWDLTIKDWVEQVYGIKLSDEN